MRGIVGGGPRLPSHAKSNFFKTSTDVFMGGGDHILTPTFVSNYQINKKYCVKHINNDFAINDTVSSYTSYVLGMTLNSSVVVMIMTLNSSGTNKGMIL